MFLAGLLVKKMVWSSSSSELFLSDPAKMCGTVKATHYVRGKFEFEIPTISEVNGTPTHPSEDKNVSQSEEPPPSRDTPAELSVSLSREITAFQVAVSFESRVFRLLFRVTSWKALSLLQFYLFRSNGEEPEAGSTQTET